MHQTVTVQQRVDVTDQECPLSFVKAKLALEDLEIGQSLEVRLREGEQLSNVTRSFESEGQRVVSRRAEAEGGPLWRVVVTREV